VTVLKFENNKINIVGIFIAIGIVVLVVAMAVAGKNNSSNSSSSSSVLSPIPYNPIGTITSGTVYFCWDEGGGGFPYIPICSNCIRLTRL
jgi:hypothetical protein